MAAVPTLALSEERWGECEWETVAFLAGNTGGGGDGSFGSSPSVGLVAMGFLLARLANVEAVGTFQPLVVRFSGFGGPGRGVPGGGNGCPLPIGCAGEPRGAVISGFEGSTRVEPASGSSFNSLDSFKEAGRGDLLPPADLGDWGFSLFCFEANHFFAAAVAVLKD